jgi:hypothetical protein
MLIPVGPAAGHCGRSPAQPARADLTKYEIKRGSLLVSQGGQFLLSLDTAPERLVELLRARCVTVGSADELDTSALTLTR